MSRTLLVRISAAALFVTLGWIAYTQLAFTQNPAPAKLTLNKVKDDLYEIEGDGGNVAVYITDEGVILIDDKFDQDHQDIVDQVKSVTNQPIKYVINTHYHQDHSGGNAQVSADGRDHLDRNGADQHRGAQTVAMSASAA